MSQLLSSSRLGRHCVRVPGALVLGGFPLPGTTSTVVHASSPLLGYQYSTAVDLPTRFQLNATTWH